MSETTIFDDLVKEIDLEILDGQHVESNPRPLLGPEEAKAQLGIYRALRARGVELSSQDAVLPWILEQIGKRAVELQGK